MVKRRSRGFTYMTVLFLVAIMGGGLALLGEMWQTSLKRERELELLFVGNQYRKAIERYYLSGPQRQYPRALEDLLKDARLPATARYLRKIYPDPITGKAEWGIVRAPDGGILGVHSTSEDKPFKAAGFKVRDAAFEGAGKYSDWKFVHAAPVQPAAGKPAAAKPPPAAALPKGSH